MRAEVEATGLELKMVEESLAKRGAALDAEAKDVGSRESILNWTLLGFLLG